ncbi:hypothetical protein EDD15DRAFT_2203284 [Pisolithus albus]|nr:hypothetical protein EDD15DRAFT_2203284 [Pisolithus albus]
MDPKYLILLTPVKHLFARSSGSGSRSVPRSLVTRAIDGVDRESSSGVVNGASITLADTTDCEAYENDRCTPPPRSRWNLNTLLDRLRLQPNAHRDDTAVGFDDEGIEEISPLTSSIKEVAISQDDIVIAFQILVVNGSLMGPTGSGKTTLIDHAVGNPDAGHGWNNSFMTDSQSSRGNCMVVDYSSTESGKRQQGTIIYSGNSGRGYCKNVILVTTMWDRVSEEVGSQCEQSDFWREMISLGSTS